MNAAVAAFAKGVNDCKTPTDARNPTSGEIGPPTFAQPRNGSRDPTVQKTAFTRVFYGRSSTAAWGGGVQKEITNYFDFRLKPACRRLCTTVQFFFTNVPFLPFQIFNSI